MIADDRPPSAPQTRSALLIHGGLAEDMDARRFWEEPGIVGALAGLGWNVAAPDRTTTPTSWTDAARQVATLIAAPTTVIAGSNGVSVALRLALDHPDHVCNLLLLWPATANDPAVDERVPSAAAHLLAGETIRGVADAELSLLSVPVAVMASKPEGPFHQHRTVDRLVEIIPGAVRIGREFPEAPHPNFATQREAFMETLVQYMLDGSGAIDRDS